MITVIFNLAGREYGVRIDQVREVIRMRKITPVPDAADFVEGVISLRGRVVTLVNLRQKLGLERKAVDKGARVVVTEIEGRIIGMIVDGVKDVTNISEENIAPPDEALKEASYLKGIARLNDRMILIADIGKLLSGDDRAGIDMVAGRVEIRKKE